MSSPREFTLGIMSRAVLGSNYEAISLNYVLVSYFLDLGMLV